jgi:hypothetical protein
MLKHLSNDQMRILNGLATGEHRPHFTNDPHLTLPLAEFDAMAPLFDAASTVVEDPAEGEVSEEGVAADIEHDRLLRGEYTLLDALEILTGDGRWAALRDRVFPGGLSMTQRTYAEEAGEAQRAAKRLDEADAAALRSVALPDGRTAFDVFQAWVAAGVALESVEKRRLRLGERVAVEQVRSIDLRNRWIRAVRMLESVVAIRGGDHPTLAAVREYEAMADRRARGGSSN